MRRLCSVSYAAPVCLLLVSTAGAQPRRSLGLNERRITFHAGEAAHLSASDDDAQFVRSAKARTAKAEHQGFVFGVDSRGEMMLAASLTTPPGEYAVSISAMSQAGEERDAVVNVVLNPMQAVPSTATKPPVVLLNGWQPGAEACR